MCVCVWGGGAGQMTNQFWAAEGTGGVSRPAVTAGDAVGEAVGARRGERRGVSPAAPGHGSPGGGSARK